MIHEYCLWELICLESQEPFMGIAMMRDKIRLIDRSVGLLIRAIFALF